MRREDWWATRRGSAAPSAYEKPIAYAHGFEYPVWREGTSAADGAEPLDPPRTRYCYEKFTHDGRILDKFRKFYGIRRITYA